MIIYRTKEGTFELFQNEDPQLFPIFDLHSENDLPAIEDLKTEYKEWRFEGKLHRETGPARIYFDGNYEFWLHGNIYDNVKHWLENHPNQDNVFHIKMILQYT